MTDQDRPPALGLLDVLVGEWTQEVSGHGDPTGTITFEWALGERYLVQRSTLPPPFPESLALIEGCERGRKNTPMSPNADSLPL